MYTSINWNLDSVFDGGVQGTRFKETLKAVEETIRDLSGRVQSLNTLNDAPEDWARMLLELEALEPQISNCWTFVHCLSCADTRDREAPTSGT